MKRWQDQAALERRRAGAADTAEERERRLDRAVLWSAIAELLALDRAAALEDYVRNRRLDPAVDDAILQIHLREAPMQGSA